MTDRSGEFETGQVDPLILTAVFDPDATARFQALRDRHFPADRNIVPVHCTLFHHLPGDARAALGTALSGWCAALAPMRFHTPGLRFLGRGVAFEVEAPGLPALRARIAAHWDEALTPQDRQGFRPHVTIQNKADPAAARALRDRLAADGTAVEGTMVGLALWHYRGGPWEKAETFRFGGGA